MRPTIEDRERHGSDPPPAPPWSLGVQVVVYRNDEAQLERLAHAVAANLAVLGSTGMTSRTEVRFGDCSEDAVLVGDVRTALAAPIERVGAQVRFEVFGDNLGSGGGSNALAAMSDDDVIWVLNPDTVPAPTCGAELLRVLTPGTVAIAEGRQIPIEHQKAYDPDTGDTGWASGCCSMIRRDAFDGVGGYDADVFPMYCDDVDLSWRLRLAGWRVVHVPSAVVFHDKRITDRGAPAWSPTQAEMHHLAIAMMYHRYGRADLAADFVERAEHGDDPAHRAAVAEFRARRDRGALPDVLTGADQVATFMDGAFAPERFRYG